MSSEEEDYEKEEEEEDEVGERSDDEDVQNDDEEDDSEEEEEEGPNEYEKDGFVVDDDEEEEEEEEEEEVPADEEEKESDEEEALKKKKRKKKRTPQLDEDEYEMLRENDPGFHGPPPKRSGGKRQFKRLKKAGRSDGDDDRFLDDEDEDGGPRPRGKKTAEELKHTLFGDDMDELQDEDEQRQDEEEEDDLDVEEDEMDDFIDDGQDVYDENGQLMRRRKKKGRDRRGLAGASSEAQMEIHDIFGDPSELLREYHMRERQDYGGEAEAEEYGEDGEDGVFYRRREGKRLDQQFEPSVLQERYMTDRDEAIRAEDLPERYQIMLEETGPPPDDANFLEEAEWIYDRAFSPIKMEAHYRDEPPASVTFPHLRLAQKKPRVVEEIFNVLQKMHVEKFEIPFIGMYRKELCDTLLRDPQAELQEGGEDGSRSRRLHRYQALWEVQRWDKKWLKLQRRKVALLRAYESQIQEGIPQDKEETIAQIIKELEMSMSEHELDDVDAKFRLQFPKEDFEMQQSDEEETGVAKKIKRPVKRSLYSMYRKAGLGPLVRAFCLAPEKVGENLQKFYKKHDVEDERRSPEELARDFMNDAFSDEQAVLKGVRHMAAVELAAEPGVKEHVRREFVRKQLTVSTSPTAEGTSAIDTFHRYACVKWLRDKPATAFDDEQWLLIEKAEREGLLEVTLTLSSNTQTELFEEFAKAFLSDSVSKVAVEWNEQRRSIIADALTKHLLPSLFKEMRVVLAGKARHYVMQHCEDSLWKLAAVAPWNEFERPSEEEQRGPPPVGPRVLACCWGSNMDSQPPTTFVVLDANGEMVDTLHTAFLASRATGAEQTRRKKEDQERLLNFIMDHKPQIAVLGAKNLQCRRLKDEIFEVVFNIAENHPRELAPGIDALNLVYADETIPSLYEASSLSQEQLPGLQGIVRRAIGLGRYLQDPLKMVASLCGPKQEVQSLRLDKNQDLLSKEEVYECIERTLVTITNQVGVDINLAAMHEWHFSTLQFVAGLGPRKASHMERVVRAEGSVQTRKALLTPLNVMTRRVFINAVGAIRVRGKIEDLDPLDDTRIHPEKYELAKHIAVHAYKEELTDRGDEIDDDILEEAIEHVRLNPDYVSRMDMKLFVKRLPDRLRAGIETLELIQEELQDGYSEWRFKYQRPAQEEEFFLLTNETPDTLAEGKLVQATVRRIQQQRVMCVLQSGLVAFVQREDLSDDPQFDPGSRMKEGNMITGRIKNVNVAEYVVDLVCKGSKLRGDEWVTRPAYMDSPFYCVDESRVRAEEEKTKKKAAEQKRPFRERMIVHPFFKNISTAEAIELLSEKDVGQFVIRPSTKGPTHLSLTLKFYDGVYMHVDIVEEGKDPRNITSFMRLGHTLKIGDNAYEDLDEVVARYVDPVVHHLKEMISFRKFKPGTTAEADAAVREEKMLQPDRIPYYISVSAKHPGAFAISFVRNVNVYHEYVTIIPEGFRFQKRTHPTPEKLSEYFKRHFTDAPDPHRRGGGGGNASGPNPRRSPQRGAPAGSNWDRAYTPSSSGWDRQPAQSVPAAPSTSGYIGGWQSSSGVDRRIASPAPPYQSQGPQFSGWGTGWSEPAPAAPNRGPPKSPWDRPTQSVAPGT